MKRGTYRSGEHLVVCDRCGATFLSSQIRKEWTGLLTCHGPGTRHCWEPRHPVDYLKAVPDRQTVQDARTRTDTFLDICTVAGRSAFVGDAVAGCSIAGLEPEFDREERV